MSDSEKPAEQAPEKPPEKPPEEKNLKAFTLIWIGQVVSLLGSGLTTFALGLWVLRGTESITQYTIIAVLAGLPGLLLAPFAGALVDRWDRKTVLILSDLGAGIITLVIGLLFWSNNLQIWHIYIAGLANAILASFQWPAFIAAITMIVPRSQFGRVNGMLQFGQAGTTIAAPALSGFLMVFVELWGVLIIDFCTFLFAVTMLAFAKIPNPPRSKEGERHRGSLFKEAMSGWVFIKERPGLLYLLIYFAATNLVTSLCGIAIVPMVMRFTEYSTASAGTLWSMVGIGTLLGGMYMTATGGPKKKINGVLGMGLFYGFFIVLAAATTNLWVVAIAILLWHVAIPITNACSTAIWQAKTPADMQGRVFSMRRLLAQFTVPLGDFSAGPLADYVFEPAMRQGGALAGTFGPLIGTGPGRGIAMMMITFALLPLLISLVAFGNKHVMNIEEDVADAVDHRSK